MDLTESTRLILLISYYCPAQDIGDKEQADGMAHAWTDVLSDLRYVDCLEAVRALVKTQTFIGVADIRAEVGRIRTSRIFTAGVFELPTGLDPDDEASYRRWLKTATEAVADGNPPPSRPALTRTMPDVDDVFRRTP